MTIAAIRREVTARVPRSTRIARPGDHICVRAA
jgi:hypothetical protein